MRPAIGWMPIRLRRRHQAAITEEHRAQRETRKTHAGIREERPAGNSGAPLMMMTGRHGYRMVRKS
jgi:hypothetical protein